MRRLTTRRISMYQKREAIGDCWAKVDELEQVWYETYMHADDGAFGQTLFKQAKKHLDQ